MTIRAKHFTPEQLLEATRRSAAYPSPDGKLALYTCSTYSFDTHSNSNEVCILDVATGVSRVLSKDENVSEPNWLGDGYDLVWLKSGDNGNTSIMITDAQNPSHSYLAGTISGPVSSLRVYFIKHGLIAVAFAGQANPDGSLYNPKDAPKSYSTARMYDSMFVRHWDSYITKQRNSIFTGLLQLGPAGANAPSQQYNLMGFANALKDTGLECPIPPYGGTDHFDIGPKGLIIVAKDPDLNPALHTKCNAYFIPRSDFTALTVAQPQKLALRGFNGAASCPVFAPDGKGVAFLQMMKDGYESDQNSILYMADVEGQPQELKVRHFMITIENQIWDRSPSSLTWSNDSRTLYARADDQGTGGLYAVSLFNDFTPNPRQIINKEFVSAVVPASKQSPLLFVSSSSLTESSIYTITDPWLSQPDTVISSASNFGNSFGLSRKQVRSLWWTGDKGRSIHALMMVPSGFNPDHKYPLAYLIHGGPQSAWNDQWSTRWNPAIFAEQGYVVVCPNPTGSTGYGQDFTNAIKQNWGGSPYVDIEKGFEYIENELSFVDTTRAVALGASYGGYMMNWIQGQPLADKLKTLVCHDGVFNMTGQLASDEQYFPFHDIGGFPWDKPCDWERWDPSLYACNWSTPMLIIHNELDYRLCVSEGLAAFNVLQCRGIESRFLSFPDENHWVLKPENSLVWHLVVLNWINSFVGLPRVVDRNGSDGSEYVQSSRGTRTSRR